MGVVVVVVVVVTSIVFVIISLLQNLTNYIDSVFFFCVRAYTNIYLKNPQLYSILVVYGPTFITLVSFYYDIIFDKCQEKNTF